MRSSARNIEKRILLTRGEHIGLRRLLRDFEDVLDCKVVFSSFMRALMRMALSNRDAIIEAAEERKGELLVPQRGDETALLLYEEELAEILRQALGEIWMEET